MFVCVCASISVLCSEARGSRRNPVPESERKRLIAAERGGKHLGEQREPGGGKRKKRERRGRMRRRIQPSEGTAEAMWRSGRRRMLRFLC